MCANSYTLFAQVLIIIRNHAYFYGQDIVWMDNLVTTSEKVYVQCCWFYYGPDGVAQLKGRGPLAMMGVEYPAGVRLHVVQLRVGVLAPAAGLWVAVGVGVWVAGPLVSPLSVVGVPPWVWVLD